MTEDADLEITREKIREALQPFVDDVATPRWIAEISLRLNRLFKHAEDAGLFKPPLSLKLSRDGTTVHIIPQNLYSALVFYRLQNGIPDLTFPPAPEDKEWKDPHGNLWRYENETLSFQALYPINFVQMEFVISP